MIIERITQKFLDDYKVDSFVTAQKTLNTLDKQLDFKNELTGLFDVDAEKTEVIQIGNSKHLIDALNTIDGQCTKCDVNIEMKDLYLDRLLEGEKAIFEVTGITDSFILLKNATDILRAETRYSAKFDILDYYHFSKFANYCRDNSFEDLVDTVKGYLRSKNLNNIDEKKLRIIYHNDDQRFYIRAFTSSHVYQDFGINFSVTVALFSIGKYVETSGRGIYIDYFSVDDSNLYISFAFKETFKISENLTLSFNLILENDEVKRSAVSFNGIFKLAINEKGKTSELLLRPPGFKKGDSDYVTDLLTYHHKGSVESVLEKIGELPKLIDSFIEQVSKDAKRITSITHTDDVRKFITDKIRWSRKPEFKSYKPQVLNKLMDMNVTNTFSLFSQLREVEDLFEHDDVVSINFWRSKLYEALIERK